MKDFLRGLLGDVAPKVATALGGPFAGMAVETLAGALGVETEGRKTEDVEEEIARKIETASAEDLLRIRKAEDAFEIKMKKLGISLERLHQLDRHSARQMRVETGDKFSNWLAVSVVALLAVTLAGFFVLSWYEVELSPEMKTIFISLISIEASAFISIIQFHFGSSSGSKLKTLMGGLGK